MFAQPRPKKPLLVPSKKRKAAPSIEEISFDNTARADYLTGFHKRKQERIKKAQEIAAEKARKEKIELRKQMREERKKDIENHVQQVNTLLREAQMAGHHGDSDDSSGNEWGGFTDPPPALEPMNFEEEYIDEDKFTTVTVESVNVDRDGLHKPKVDDSSEDDDDEAQTRKETKVGNESAKVKEQQRPKKKKKKFRYETKVERRATERKQRAKKLAARS
ncbi:hypothetical protein RB594_002210 [Gaeumannomyces avenae]